ncbi:MAG: YdcF family protein [Acidobacteria bacterium]|nr:YdcF family protein [Acidobacteriota bacterium]
MNLWKIGLAAMVAFVVWIPTAWLLGRYLVVSQPVENPDAIVVLAGSAEYEERNLEAARLYREGAAPRIILTNDGMKGGWNNELGRNPYFVEKARWLLIANGVPEAAIEEIPEPIRDRGEIGTEVEAKKVLAFCRDKGYGRLLIVTSPYHTRRALITYLSITDAYSERRSIGIVHPSVSGLDVPNVGWWLRPMNWRIVISEYMKMAFAEEG